MTRRRFRGLPTIRTLGVDVLVAATFRSRLLGLALLDRSRAPAGLLIPRCSSVHTFGMRFPIDVLFLDREGAVIAAEPGVAPRRLIRRRGAAAVLELPTGDQARRGRSPGRRG
jgi:uncharacterized membrane protein (UPF0127 family)